MATETPAFEHDCTGCTYLGRFQDDRGVADLYHCRQGGGWPTVIARWSSDGPDYASGLSFALPRGGYPPIPALAEARRRSIARGLPVEPAL